MLTPQEEKQLRELKAKRDRLPSSPKVTVWDGEIQRLQNKARKASKKVLNENQNTRSRKSEPTNQLRFAKGNMSNSNVKVDDAITTISGQITESMKDGLASMINPDVGAVRFPDGCEIQTSLYHSVYQTNVYVDPTVNGGAFRIIVQPKLGGKGRTSQYFVAMSNETTNNFGSSGAFVSSNEGTDPRVDKELDKFLNCPPSQNTFSMVYNLANAAPSVNVYPSNVSRSGVNNDDYFFYQQGVFSSELGFTPAHGAFVLPVGTFYHSISLGGYSNFAWFNNNQNFQMIGNTGSIDIVLSLFEYNYSTATENQIDRFRIMYNPNTQSVTSYTAPNTNYIQYVKGTISGNTNSSVNQVLTAQFYTSYESNPGSIWYLAFEIDNFPQTNNGNAPQLQMSWDITSSATDIAAYLPCEGAAMLRVRPTAQKVHFQCTLSEFNNSGEIALNLLQGGAQANIFAANGGEKATFTSLSNNNLPLRMYSGKLENGVYGFWVPDNLLDIQLRTYNKMLDYNYPFFAVAGNWTPSGANSGLQKIGILRVVTNYEWTTTSLAWPTQVQPGADYFLDILRATCAQIPKCMENPSHTEILKEIARRANGAADAIVKVGSTAVKLGTGAISLLNAVGL